ncbi:MAG: GNAT family N-acetyltransferase [Lachnospiraceae bacterium]|uniref:GNAT family N-acetyltransferase n=1 Tax=Falcatimonas sp. MSJ-15 TaxID=2841515 RepID=UPI001C109427|nr:GNAT family N-acetyltransferase [Falcatimonas sp. MSJ-15]MBU5471150.1 N-acetyltransferase [Falcatimonas sp. MSJ-15]MEE0959956.1 GNAT family N-acetyltransferase [Lachnospiraceae bacterium]
MEFKYDNNRIYIEKEDKTLLAEITFPEVETGVCDINHTYVSDELRGQGIAGKLVKAAVNQIKKEGKTFRTSCSYAASWTQKHADEIAD